MTSLSKLSSGCKRVAAATTGQLRRPDRMEALKRALRHWTFMNEQLRIPESYPNELWPAMRDLPVSIPVDMESDFELPLGERAILAGLVAAKKPRTIFELGTFTGTTTALLADISPRDTHIHTIDLPDSGFSGVSVPDWFTPDMVGRHFVGDEEYKDRITLYRSDIRDFDFSPFRADVDLVFVDADHAYESVVRDSRLALELVTPRGTIVWDDYQPAHWGVVRALNELAETVELRRVAQTRFVVYEAE